MPAGEAAASAYDRRLIGATSLGDVALMASAQGVLGVADFGSISLVSDVILNDSNKSITVPAGQTWHITAILIDFTATAIVGSRQIHVDLLNATSVLFAFIRPEGIIGASDRRIYSFTATGNQDTSILDNRAIFMLPVGLYLPPGYVVNIYDFNAIDVAADDMLIHILHNTHTL